ncbi:flavoprotein [Lactiplantibacillus paraplantarum]|uniref:flavoprotein n=1 Tax=Lactiplantibacillus paraplantarum TaxID=60520 RepID=UPI001575E9EE|nr:flavoprotein [Lactiplantibacillus paraplantarum]MDL2063343.1 flavoprotein [Lactiplantibacillus paraplantarum]
MAEKNIIVGICGAGTILGIPEYLAMLSSRVGHVRVIATKNATQVMSEAALSMVCEHVYTDDISFKGDQNHISLSRWADMMIFLPATANTIGKLANGIADTFLTTTALAFNKKKVIFPSMNNLMWENTLVQDNLSKLDKFSFDVYKPIMDQTFEIASQKMRRNITIPSLTEVLKQLNDTYGTSLSIK